MARESRSPIARADSQVFPRATETTLAQTFYKRIDGIRRKDETFSASRSRSDEKTVARHCLATDYFAQVVGKMFERREAAGLGVEMNKIETPAALLMAAVLTDDPIKPALKSTRAAVHIRGLLPLVNPGEPVPPALRRLTDRRHHAGRLQPVERRLEAV